MDELLQDIATPPSGWEPPASPSMSTRSLASGCTAANAILANLGLETSSDKGDEGTASAEECVTRLAQHEFPEPGCSYRDPDLRNIALHQAGVHTTNKPEPTNQNLVHLPRKRPIWRVGCGRRGKLDRFVDIV